MLRITSGRDITVMFTASSNPTTDTSTQSKFELYITVNHDTIVHEDTYFKLFVVEWDSQKNSLHFLDSYKLLEIVVSVKHVTAAIAR